MCVTCAYQVRELDPGSYLGSNRIMTLSESFEKDIFFNLR